ncbi:MAG: hypothetical protein QXF47_05935 [Candidatus Caldarchaeum sp.]
MKQDNPKILVIKKSSNITIEPTTTINLPTTPVEVIENTMFGPWIYAVFVQNGALRTKVMNQIEQSLRAICDSSGEEVAASFMAGLLDAEGGCEHNKKRVTISVSLRKKSGNFEFGLYAYLLRRLGVKFFTVRDDESIVLRIPRGQLPVLVDKVASKMRCSRKVSLLQQWAGG